LQQSPLLGSRRRRDNPKDREARHIELNLAKWNGWARSIEKMKFRREYLRKAQNDVLSLLNLKKGVRFLDVGCGPGWALEDAAKLAGGKGEFYGVDLSPLMVEKAQADYAGRPNFHFIVSNAESIPLESGSFDVIICTNSFHHYLNPGKAMAEFYRLLRPGGRLCILDPTSDRKIVRFADRIIRLIEPEHVKLYNTEEFREFFESVGLRHSFAESSIKSHRIQIGDK